MILHGSETSPFVRKCRIVALEQGIELTLEIHSAFAGGPPVPNPVQRIPSLLTDDGTLLVDSRVICDYLINFSDRSLDDRNLEALCDGLMDRAVSRTLMRREEECFHNPAQLHRWEEAIKRSLDHLESTQPSLPSDFNIGTITLLCALAYLDFRHDDLNWRNGRPNLAQWFETESRRDSVNQTKVPQ